MNAIEKWSQPGAAQQAQRALDAAINPIDVEIEGFTADDFATEKPYIYILMNHGDSEPVLQGLKMKLKKQADRCKVKSREFDAMLKSVFTAHSDLLPRTVSATPESKCEYEGLDRFGIDADQIKCLGYKMTMAGVGSVANFKGVDVPIKVCSHPILITKRYENVLSNYETVDISYYRDGHWKTLRQIPIADVYSATKVVTVLASRGISVTSETAKAMVTFLQETYDANRNVIKSVKSTDQIGWQPDGTFAPYTSDMEIDAGGDAGELAAMAAALREEGSPEVWVDGVKSIRAQENSLPVRMMMASSFASPLLEKLGCLPYWTHMVGNGSTGKTVTMRLVSTIWGYAPVSGGWMKTMNGTTCAIEEMAGFAHNLPLCLNELQTIQNEKNFAQRIYDFCEGQGRNRGRRSGGLRDTKRWFGGALSCGEQSIVTGSDRGGANSRVIEIPVSTKLYSDPQTFCSEVLDKSYGHAGKMFIEGLAGENWDALKKEIIDAAHRLEALGKNEKQADAAAIMLLADRLAEKYVFHDGIRVTEDDIADYLKDKAEIDDNVRCLDYLRGFMAANYDGFISRSNPTPAGRKLGRVYTSEDLDGLPRDTYKVWFLQTEFDPAFKEAGFDVKRFITWAVEKGIAEDGRKYGDGKHLAILKRGVKDKVAARVYIFTMKAEEESERSCTDVTEQVLSELPF